MFFWGYLPKSLGTPVVDVWQFNRLLIISQLPFLFCSLSLSRPLFLSLFYLLSISRYLTFFFFLLYLLIISCSLPLILLIQYNTIRAVLSIKIFP